MLLDLNQIADFENMSRAVENVVMTYVESVSQDKFVQPHSGRYTVRYSVKLECISLIRLCRCANLKLHYCAI